MYDVNVFVYGPEGEDLSFHRICNEDEVKEFYKVYSKEDILIDEIKDASLSPSRETCFCPYCMKMKFIKEKNTVYICNDCNKKYFVSL